MIQRFDQLIDVDKCIFKCNKFNYVYWLNLNDCGGDWSSNGKKEQPSDGTIENLSERMKRTITAHRDNVKGRVWL